MFNRYSGVLLCTTLLIVALSLVKAQDDAEVGTCGGFVEAAAHLAPLIQQRLDYSFVQMHLYTAEGLLKYSTDCSPNGYYFIPVYDKGSFYLEIEGPEGWNFDPPRVNFVVDDQHHGCSDDIHFKFTGFALSGKVSGSRSASCTTASGAGPEGVELKLQNSQGEFIGTAVSDSAGAFIFSNVFPDNYTVVAQHEKLAFSVKEQKVELGFGNVDAPSVIHSTGGSVSGQVVSSDAGLEGVDVFLFTSAPQSEKISLSCTPPSGKADVPTRSGQRSLCVTKTDSSGAFRFDGVPCGLFTIVPFYHREDTKFEVLPASRDVSVEHGDYVVEEAFQVTGFSVSGRVVDRTGQGVSGVAIHVDGTQKAVTDADGQYRLDGMKSQKYSIKALKPHVFFHELKGLGLTTQTVKLPDMTVVRFHVCGKVDTADSASGRKVVLADVKFNREQSKQTDDEGSYCFEVVPGTYKLTPESTKSEEAKGLLISPPSRTITVDNEPVLDADFSQARISVSGRVKCLSMPCDSSVRVELSPQGAAHHDSGHRHTTVQKDGSFIFEGVFPGKIRVAVNQDSWCWTEAERVLSVSSADVKDLSFVQSGFMLETALSHDISLKVSQADSKKDVVHELRKGANKVCLSTAGLYQLRPESCFKFDKEVYTYDTSHPSVLQLNAVEFRVDGDVAVEDELLASNAKASRLAVDVIRLNAAGEVASTTTVDAVLQRGKTSVYSYSFWTAPNQRYSVRPRAPTSAKDIADAGLSKAVLMYPDEVSVSVGASPSGCLPAAPAVTARGGVFISGRLSPPLEGISIVVLQRGHTDVILTVQTDKKGKYNAGPLHDNQKYVTEARGDGYDFVVDGQDSDTERNFRAVKLGRVDVKVADGSKQPISGVLLSLSGDSYRSHNRTSDKGTFSFTSLFPGMYHLRPILKEYEFTPKATSMDVAEASMEDVKFVGRRIEYSVFGKCVSLSGDEQADVIVEAIAVDSSADGQRAARREETKTDSSGQYRLRGLRPGTKYSIRVKTTAESASSAIESAAPSGLIVEMAKADVHGVDFVTFARSKSFDLTGRVNVSVAGADSALAREWLEVVDVALYDEASPSSALKVASVSIDMPFFEFNALPAGSYIIRLRSSSGSRSSSSAGSTSEASRAKARNSVSFSSPDVHVTLNQHRHVEPQYQGQLKAREAQEMQAGSLMPLILVAIAFILFNAREKIQGMMSEQVQVTRSPSSESAVYTQSKTSKKRR